MNANTRPWRAYAGPSLSGVQVIQYMGRGNILAVEWTSRNLDGRDSIPCLGSRRSSLISIEHAELPVVR